MLPHIAYMDPMGMSQSATPTTENDRKTSSDTLRKTRFWGFPHRHANFSPTKVAHIHSSSHVECRATSATENDMSSSSDTLRKTCFCGFPHRHANFSPTTAVRKRLRTVADTKSRVQRTRLHPQTPKMENKNPSLRIREKHTHTDTHTHTDRQTDRQTNRPWISPFKHLLHPFTALKSQSAPSQRQETWLALLHGIKAQSSEGHFEPLEIWGFP